MEGFFNTETRLEREFTSRLIDLYRDSPELWKVKSKDYFNRNKRNAAIEKIVEVLKELKPDFTVENFKQKINTLRTNFNRQHKVMEEKRASTDDIPEPSLWYYYSLYFIRDQNETASTEASEPILSDDSQSLPAQTALPSPIRTSKSTSRKRKHQPDSTEHLAGPSSEYFIRPEEEEDILAKGWAIKLKRLLPDQKLFAEKIINDTLFEAEMGTLTREGVHFVTCPRWSPSPPS
ncbi:uncharacterized protein LOC123307141 [Coccinella septempunctata]|uniref:uncharacterized protein LOC123307141 n=1 Tax=Coccinella septempunctata TaxID=41139 RepID=UPI001D0934DE|nr:uncharacterized protein LOC123307141 [Coccinella septempunctata]